jgi:hypothetical protein
MLSGGEAQRTSWRERWFSILRCCFWMNLFRHLIRSRAGVLFRDRRTVADAPHGDCFCTHDLAEVSMLCDRCAILDAGVVLQCEPIAQVISRPLTARVAEIVGVIVVKRARRIPYGEARQASHCEPADRRNTVIASFVPGTRNWIALPDSQTS